MVLRLLTFVPDSLVCSGWTWLAGLSACRADLLAQDALAEVTLDSRRQVADVEAVHAPANRAQRVRGILMDVVARSVWVGPDAVLFEEAPLLLEAPLLAADADADEYDDPGHDSDHEDSDCGSERYP
jgi:hypothetical protein